MSTRFKKGQSGNPNGRPRLPEDVKSALSFNTMEFTRRANKFLFMSLHELEGILRDNTAEALDLMIAKILHGAIESGDHRRLDFFLDRLVGKVKTEVDVNTSVNIHSQIVELISQIEAKKADERGDSDTSDDDQTLDS